MVQRTKRELPRAPGQGLTYWALIGFTVILLLAPQQQFPVLAPLRIALLSVAVAVVACGYSRNAQRLPLLEFSPEVVLILLFAVWAVFTVPFSTWPGGSVTFMTEVFLKAVICFLLLAHAITDFRQLQGIAWCIVLCTLPLTAITLFNYVSGARMEGSGDRVIGYSSGLAGNPNDMALLLNMILPLSIALLLSARGAISRLVLTGIAMLIVVAIIVTFSRAGFLTLVFIGACYAWLLRNRPQRAWLPVILALSVLALPLVPSSYFDRIDTIINIEEDQTGSAQTRLADMKASVEVALSRPVIGAGVGMSALALNEVRQDSWSKVHNVFLQLALDLGFVGMLLFALLLYQCLRATRQESGDRSNDPDEQRLRFIAEALRVTLLAFALSAMFYPVAYNFYFYFFAGMAVAAGRIVRGGGAVTRET